MYASNLIKSRVSSGTYHGTGSGQRNSSRRQASTSFPSIPAVTDLRNKMAVESCGQCEMVLADPQQSPSTHPPRLPSQQTLPSMQEFLHRRAAASQLDIEGVHPDFLSSHLRGFNRTDSASSLESSCGAMSLDEQESFNNIKGTTHNKRSVAGQTAPLSASDVHRRGEKDRRHSTKILGHGLLSRIPIKWSIICDRLASDICNSRTNTGKEPARHVVSFYADTLLEYQEHLLRLHCPEAYASLYGQEATGGLPEEVSAIEIIHSQCQQFKKKKKSATATSGVAVNVKQPKNKYRMRSTGANRAKTAAGSRFMSKL